MKKRYFKQKEEHDNTYAVVRNLLLYLDVPATTTTIRENLTLHPDYPSLSSISYLLKELNIDNLSLKLELSDLKQCPSPFIAHLYKKDRGNYFVMVNSINDMEIEYIDTKEGWVVESIKNFQEKWTSFIILPIKNKHSGETNYKPKKVKENYKSWTISLVLMLLFIIFLLTSTGFIFIGDKPQIFDWILLMALKSIGVSLSILLLHKTIFPTTEEKDFCSLWTNKKNFNCNKIIFSKSSQIFGVINMSDLGFIYFLGGYLSILVGFQFQSPINNTLYLLGIINITTLPYTIYSIYYQFIKEKTICVLCLSIQILFWVEFSFLVKHIDINIIIFNTNTLFILSNYLYGILIIIFINKLKFEVESNKQKSIDLIKFKSNPIVYKSLLGSSSLIAKYKVLNEIVLGEKEAKNNITLVISPKCPHCATAFNEITNLFDRDSQNFKITIKVLFSEKSHDDTGMSFASYLFYNSLNRHSYLLKTIKDWYLKKNMSAFDKFLENKKFMSTQENQNFIKEQINWCQHNKIVKTPTIFINSYEIPKGFTAKEVKYFL